MAKMKRYPKQPKANASLKTWENYKKKADEVAKFNAGIKAVKNKKEAIKNGVQKQKDKLK